MASVLDQSLTLAKEVTYNVPVAPTRGYVVDTDNFSREVVVIDNAGLRAGKQGQLDERYEAETTGVSGAIEGPFTHQGQGLIWTSLLGDSTAPTAIANATPAVYTQTATSNSTGPTDSFTAILTRVDSLGERHYYSYAGLVPTAFSISVSQGEATNYSITYSGASESVSSTGPTPVYPTVDRMYTFKNTALLVDDVVSGTITSFSLDVDLGMDTERAFVREDSARAKPIRNGQPSFTGSFSAEFADLTIYNKFVNNESVKLALRIRSEAPIATIPGTGGAQDTDVFGEFVITMPVVRFDSANPTASTSALTVIDGTFIALHQAPNPICTISYTSTDDTP